MLPPRTSTEYRLGMVTKRLVHRGPRTPTSPEASPRIYGQRRRRRTSRQFRGPIESGISGRHQPWREYAAIREPRPTNHQSLLTNHFSPQSGSALLLVLFTLLLISGLVLSALTFLESGVEDYGALNHQFQARQLARSGLAYGLNPQISNQDTPLLNQKFKPNGEFHVVITSESTKLNVNSLLEQGRDDILQTLFLQWNVPLDAVNEVINGLKKWTNGNQEIQPVGSNMPQAAPAQQAGVETGQLPGVQTGQQQGIQLVRPFMAVSEMAEVPGFNAVIEAKPNWADYFTVWSDGTIDVNLADPSMISLVTGVTPATATQFVKHIWGPDGIPFTSDDLPYQDWNDVMLQLGMSSQQFQIVQNLLSLTSTVDRVDSTGTIGKYSTTISVVAKRASIPVAYLLWQEK
jgi:general secretion pathway protein K